MSEVCLQVDDLLDAYVLDALDPSERDLVDRHLETCPEQRERLAELTEVVGILGGCVPSVAPPPAVWQRLLAETDPAPRAEPAATEGYPTWGAPVAVARRSNVVVLNRWVAWTSGIAAALLLASTVALGAALGRDDEPVVAKDPVVEMVARGGEVKALSTQPQPEAITEVGQGSILTAPGMNPAVVVDHWTPSNETLRYIVWMAAASGGVPTVLGEITIDEDGHGVLVLTGVTSFEGYDVFGISIQTTEEAGLQDVLLGAPPEQIG